MRLARYDRGDGARSGVVADGYVSDVTEAFPSFLDLIGAGAAGLAWAEGRALASREQLSLDGVTLLPPLPQPERGVMCVGLNYMDHAREGARRGRRGGELPTRPVWFLKAGTSFCGARDDIVIDERISEQYDWEAELAIVIGTGGHDIGRSGALTHVHSLCVLNDVTCRDLQHSYGEQWFVGKSVDRTSPVGPWLTTIDEVTSLEALEVGCAVNGVEKQRASIGSLIFDIPALIADISHAITLRPGDVISTGTPAGVGSSREPREFLTPGDSVETWVTGLGGLTNRCVAG